MNWKRRKLQFADQALLELSQMLTQDDAEPTFGVEQLESAQLDYSVTSLAVVNHFLDTVRATVPDGRPYAGLVLRCGAYTGEVVRRASMRREYHWIDFENAVKADPTTFNELGYSLGTAAVLWAEGPIFVFPLAKVAKYLENGREDDLRLFAEVVLART